jgi:hypothetical protein
LGASISSKSMTGKTGEEKERKEGDVKFLTSY